MVIYWNTAEEHFCSNIEELGESHELILDLVG